MCHLPYPSGDCSGWRHDQLCWVWSVGSGGGIERWEAKLQVEPLNGWVSRGVPFPCWEGWEVGALEMDSLHGWETEGSQALGRD